jgi:hypothetical protein
MPPASHVFILLLQYVTNLEFFKNLLAGKYFPANTENAEQDRTKKPS